MIRGVLILSLIIFFVNVGYMFSAPIVKNRMLQGKMVEIAKNRANKSDQALRADLMKYVKDKDIDIDPQEIMLERHDDKVYIAALYSTQVSFYNYSRHYEFFPMSDDRAALYWRQDKRGVRTTGT